MKKVVVVILNFKVRVEVIKCIRSVKESSYSNLEIIVVDNNSEDSLGEYLRQYSDIVFIQTGSNLGYSGGNNVGLKKALEREADYVLILNPDTTLEKDTIRNLVFTAEEANAGIAGPKILFADKKTIWCAGGKLDLLNVIGENRGIDELDHGQYSKVEEVDFISGCAMLIKRDVLDKIGLFDESYFMYYEDDDLSYRAKKAGYKLIFVPQAIVYHDNAKSAGACSPFQDYYLTRNRMIFAQKFLSWRTRFALFREVLKQISIPSRRLALFDYLRGNLGKGSFLK